MCEWKIEERKQEGQGRKETISTMCSDGTMDDLMANGKWHDKVMRTRAGGVGVSYIVTRGMVS